MTNRTREFFDFAQSEPTAVYDMSMQLNEMTSEELGDVEQTIEGVQAAMGWMGKDDSEDPLEK